MEERRRLARDTEHRMIGGVCAGVARQYDYDVTVVRVVFVLLSLVSGLGLLAYVAMWLLLPPLEVTEGESTTNTIRGNVDDITSRAREAATAARQAGDQLSEATRAGVSAARETWQQRAAATAAGASSAEAEGDRAEAPADGEPKADSADAGASDLEPDDLEPGNGKPGATTPDGSETPWPPDRPLPMTDAAPGEDGDDDASTAWRTSSDDAPRAPAHEA